MIFKKMPNPKGTWGQSVMINQRTDPYCFSISPQKHFFVSHTAKSPLLSRLNYQQRFDRLVFKSVQTFMVPARLIQLTLVMNTFSSCTTSRIHIWLIIKLLFYNKISGKLLKFPSASAENVSMLTSKIKIENILLHVSLLALPLW